MSKKQGKSIRIDKYGIWFNFKVDRVCWVWWWKRKMNNNKKIYSIDFCAAFKSLSEISKEWNNYFEAMIKSEV